jgi:hypothetical protein
MNPFFKSPLDGAELVVYHRWDGQEGDGPYKGRRQVAIELEEYDENGLIRPIVMTD